MNGSQSGRYGTSHLLVIIGWIRINNLKLRCAYKHNQLSELDLTLVETLPGIRLRVWSIVTSSFQQEDLTRTNVVDQLST